MMMSTHKLHGCSGSIACGLAPKKVLPANGDRRCETRGQPPREPSSTWPGISRPLDGAWPTWLVSWTPARTIASEVSRSDTSQLARSIARAPRVSMIVAFPADNRHSLHSPLHGAGDSLFRCHGLTLRLASSDQLPSRWTRTSAGSARPPSRRSGLHTLQGVKDHVCEVRLREQLRDDVHGIRMDLRVAGPRDRR